MQIHSNTVTLPRATFQRYVNVQAFVCRNTLGETEEYISDVRCDAASVTRDPRCRVTRDT